MRACKCSDHCKRRWHYNLFFLLRHKSWGTAFIKSSQAAGLAFKPCCGALIVPFQGPLVVENFKGMRTKAVPSLQRSGALGIEGQLCFMAHHCGPGTFGECCTLKYSTHRPVWLVFWHNINLVVGFPQMDVQSNALISTRLAAQHDICNDSDIAGICVWYSDIQSRANFFSCKKKEKNSMLTT